MKPSALNGLRIAGLAAAVVLLTGMGVVLHRADLRTQMLKLSPDTESSLEVTAYATGRAKPLFREHCAACHQASMKGSHDTGVPDLTDREWIYGTGRVNEIEQTILYGIRSGHHRAHNLADMPAFGTARPYRRYAVPSFTPTQIADLTEYVVALQRKPIDRTKATRGEALFKGAGQCYDCHMSDASGDTFVGAPSLVDKVWLYGTGSRADIAHTLTQGRAGVCPAWAGRLSAADIRALALYINAVARGRARS